MLFPTMRRNIRSRILGPLIGSHLKSGETLLDVGGGTGFFARWLKDHAGVHATLSDIVDYAADRDASLPFILQKDLRRVPAEDNSFDNVLLMFVLHHIDSAALQEQIVRETFRVARRRVLIVEDTPESPWDWAMNKSFDWALNVRHRIPTPYTFRSSADWSSTFAAMSLPLASLEKFRSVWPTFGLFRQALFVLDASAKVGQATTPQPAGTL